ncbi:oligosaccharide flippase family protein, partial [Phenylobacterium sp.]|uniref:oligosaccharide flippase family protein n=1 Tax=Phenylobacterium sp. TaxID=1871053 RepID=UPI0030F3EF55
MRDVAQFGIMLILVRLLTPADYGTAALVQAILGVFSIVSSNTFYAHALQQRNPDDIDWQVHFTSAVVLNAGIAALVLVLAFGLSLVDRYSVAAAPLAALAVVFVVEIPAGLRHRMLEVRHDWKRFRLMLVIGAFLGLGVGLAVGLMGGGVWALIVQIPLGGLPAAIDLFVAERFKPDWTWSWARYRKTA